MAVSDPECRAIIVMCVFAAIASAVVHECYGTYVYIWFVCAQVVARPHCSPSFVLIIMFLVLGVILYYYHKFIELS